MTSLQTDWHGRETSPGIHEYVAARILEDQGLPGPSQNSPGAGSPQLGVLGLKGLCARLLSGGISQTLRTVPQASRGGLSRNKRVLISESDRILRLFQLSVDQLYLRGRERATRELNEML